MAGQVERELQAAVMLHKPVHPWTLTIESATILGGLNDCGEEYFVEEFAISAHNDYGLVYAYTFKSWDDESEAVAALQSMESRMSADWTPENSDYWGFSRYAYGSRAHSDNWFEVEESLMDDEERKVRGLI